MNEKILKIQKQGCELLEQAFNRGYKAGKEEISNKYSEGYAQGYKDALDGVGLKLQELRLK